MEQGRKTPETPTEKSLREAAQALEAVLPQLLMAFTNPSLKNKAQTAMLLGTALFKLGSKYGEIMQQLKTTLGPQVEQLLPQAKQLYEQAKQQVVTTANTSLSPQEQKTVQQVTQSSRQLKEKVPQVKQQFQQRATVFMNVLQQKMQQPSPQEQMQPQQSTLSQPQPSGAASRGL